MVIVKHGLVFQTTVRFRKHGFPVNGAKLHRVVLFPRKTVWIAVFPDKCIPDKRGFTVIMFMYGEHLSALVNLVGELLFNIRTPGSSVQTERCVSMLILCFVSFGVACVELCHARLRVKWSVFTQIYNKKCNKPRDQYANVMFLLLYTVPF